MSLVAIRESRRARAVAEDILLERLLIDLERDGLEAGVAFDGEGQLGIVPVFTLGPEDFHLDRLGNAWKVGWRYFWMHPAIGAGAIVSVRADGKRSPQLSRYQWGKKALGYADRLDQTVERYRDAPGRQRMRILRLAPLQMEAIWVTSREIDKLIGFVPQLEDQAFLDEAASRFFTLQSTDKGRPVWQRSSRS